MKRPNNRPITATILAALLIFIGAGALISGAMLFSAPDGSLIKMPKSYLEGSPFASFLIPGIILFIGVGIFPVFTGYGLLAKPGWKWPEVINPDKGVHWAWTAAWAAAVIMLIWISVETILLGYISFLQPFIAGYGILLLILTFWPGTRNYYKTAWRKKPLTSRK
jgi:hypothetical protein